MNFLANYGVIFWILAIVALLFGGFLLWISLRQRQMPTDDTSGQKKGKLPIVPRHKRTQKAFAHPNGDIDDGLQDKISVDMSSLSPNAPKKQPKLKAIVRQIDDDEEFQIDDTSDDTHIVIDSPFDKPTTNNPKNTANANSQAHDALSNLAAAAMQSGKTVPQSTKQAHTAQSTTTQPATASNPPVATQIPTQDGFNNPANQPFEGEVRIANKHLANQENYSDHHGLRNNEALLNHKQTITIMITPKNNFSTVSGKQVLSFAKTYAMKYGIMDMFHRYENANGTGYLWFSMLGVTHEGIVPFDLNAMPNENYRALALFVSLPHRQALKGFDSMIEVAYAIGESIDGNLHDEEGFVLDNKQIALLRALAEDNIL